MPNRTIVTAILALAAGAYAQPTGPGQGRGGFGPGMTGAPQDARLLGAVAGVPRRVVTNAPYSATTITETTQTLADGNRIHHPTTGKIYRDSAGRVRNEQTLAGLDAFAPHAGAPQQVVFLNDPVAGMNYALNVHDKTYTKSTWTHGGRPGGRDVNGGRRGDAASDGPPGGRFGRGPQDAGPNVKTESLGRRTFAGLPADGTRTTITIPAGQMGNEQPMQIVSEVWYSADLHTAVFSKHVDPRVGETVFRLADISRSEPAAGLFQPPADYQVTEAGADAGRQSAPQVGAGAKAH
jgi:hypothetical protein